MVTLGLVPKTIHKYSSPFDVNACSRISCLLASVYASHYLSCDKDGRGMTELFVAVPASWLLGLALYKFCICSSASFP